MSQRATVVGGGVIGLSIAWELAGRGYEVTLLEREAAVGRETSWSAAGILPPARYDTATDPIDQLRGLSHELFPRWAETLHSITGIDPGYRRCGGWYLAASPGERASMIGMTHYWNDLGIGCQPVDAERIAVQEPELRLPRDDSTDAWWVEDECQIRSPDYLDALRAACLQAGVEIRVNQPVDAFRCGGPRVAIHSPGGWTETDRVIFCGGAWTGKIADRLKLHSAIVPVRGQVLLLKSDRPLLRSIVNVGHRYVLCRADGHTLVGSNEEEVGFARGTTDETIKGLRQFALRWVPRLQQARQVRTWSGLRPMTFDGFPIIGKLPETENVFVAAGHFRSGIHLSPATAVCLADRIDGRSPPINLDAFRVGKQQSESAR